MHRIVLRPFLVVLTLAMLFVALVQSTGRLGFMILSDLELAANQWLSGQRVRVSGLEGSWRYLNPVVRVDHVEFPAGYLHEVLVELDWLESLVRNRFVARRVLVEDGAVRLEKTPEGNWRVAGTVGGGEFDASGIIYHADELRFSGAIALGLAGEEKVQALEVDYVATNRGGLHRHRLHVENQEADCAAGCGLHVEYQARDGRWPFWDERIQLSVDGGGFLVPAAVLGSPLELLSLGVEWHLRGDDSGGQLHAHARGLRLPGNVEVAGLVRAEVIGFEDVHDAVVHDLALRVVGYPGSSQEQVRTERALRMPPVRVRKDAELIQFWTPSVDMGGVSEFLERALKGAERTARWLRALDLQAEALNVRGYYRLPTGESGFAATLADIDLDGYRGAPFMRGAAGELLGHARGLELKLKGEDVLLKFPQTFTDTWQMPYLQGGLQAWFGNGYLGLRGVNLRAETLFSRAAGSFALTRPANERFEERLSLLIGIDALDTDQAFTFVPYTLDDGLKDWLDRGLKAGLLTRVRFGYHGQQHLKGDELARRVELSARISDGRIAYAPDWPEVHELDADVVVAGQMVRVSVDKGVSEGVRLGGSQVVLRDNAAYADLELVSRMETGLALNFVRTTPLADSLRFVGPDWDGDGRLEVLGDLHVPIKLAEGVEATEQLQVDVNVRMFDAGLQMPDFRLALAGLEGDLRYGYPGSLRSSRVSGSLFGNDVFIEADSDAQEMILSFAGRATHEDLLAVLDMADPGVVTGSADFLASLHVGVDPDHVTRLEVFSDLKGMALDLPADLRKPAEVDRPVEVAVQFLDDRQIISFRHGTAQGWLHVAEAPERGAVGFGQPPPVLDGRADYLLLTGEIEGFELEEVVPDEEGGGSGFMPLKLSDLRVGQILLDEFAIVDAVIDGDIMDDGFAIAIASDAVAGDISLDGDAPLVLKLDRVVLPAGDGEGDPLSPEVAPELPEAAVEVGEFRVGDADYGRWRFKVHPEPDGVRLADLEAVVRGVTVSSPEGVYWSTVDGESRFTGELAAENLYDVLPQWGFAASMETKSAGMTGELSWAGSPANVDIDLLVGTASVRAETGSFVDVESGGGALRMFSLINFDTIAKRMRGDFSDLTGKGLTFDELKATVSFDRGQLAFVEPMKVKGSGSEFELAGNVDLVTGELDNEMIVTLPVSKSLPWYAAYIALANPLAGAGILVGERVLRKPLEQFSSAKYEIGGTLEEPEVNLVSVFETEMDEVEVESLAGTSDEDTFTDLETEE
ncbi:MAG: hypothetical protein GWM88_02150 [Pseudomonadales bacterium]|nr:hypothetical protein [Pseudomonadales bacterium]NIX06882.1 hypothetical protein [Pseudomonadales bacterium]